MNKSDDEIVNEVLFLIAQRKGLAVINVDFQTGEATPTIHADRNWLMEAIRHVKQAVETAR